jgi:hypothetical protein
MFEIEEPKVGTDGFSLINVEKINKSSNTWLLFGGSYVQARHMSICPNPDLAKRDNHIIFNG